MMNGSSNGDVSPSFFGPQFSQWGEVGATSVIVMVPMLALSIFVQRYLVAGLTMGAVK
jgi:multiple sugar transport system permease protein